ncbi:hypothetical protein SDC9_111852 [bioreactor metagenome]|uniref:Uncharacterized protein n=1 Tax=bioreactor metagenome TaxID=1076179 RepID=A0A645BHL3_9ZZZZ
MNKYFGTELFILFGKSDNAERITAGFNIFGNIDCAEKLCISARISRCESYGFAV